MNRPRIGIVAPGQPGGAQALAVEAARALSTLGPVTLLAWPATSRAALRRMYGGPLPFRLARLPPGAAPRRPDIAGLRRASLWTAGFDLVIVCTTSPVFPLARRSILLCTYPWVPRHRFPGLVWYDTVASISRYTRLQIRRVWGVRRVPVLYPGVPRVPGRKIKDRRILAVARMNAPQRPRSAVRCKGHLEILQAWRLLRRRHPDLGRTWSLSLVGAAGARPLLLPRLRSMARRIGRVRLLVDLPRPALRRAYARAAILWHPAGMNQRHPGLREHFGIAVVEGMSAGAVPVVMDSGGPAEIVRQGRDGYRVRTIAALARRSASLMQDPALRGQMSRSARIRAQAFGTSRFAGSLRRLARAALRGRTLASQSAERAALALGWRPTPG